MGGHSCSAWEAAKWAAGLVPGLRNEREVLHLGACRAQLGGLLDGWRHALNSVQTEDSVRAGTDWAGIAGLEHQRHLRMCAFVEDLTLHLQVAEDDGDADCCWRAEGQLAEWRLAGAHCRWRAEVKLAEMRLAKMRSRRAAEERAD